MTRQLKMLLLTTLSAGMLTIPWPTYGQVVAIADSFLREQVALSFPNAESIKLSIQPPDNRLDLSACQSPQVSLHGTKVIRSRVLVRVECSPTFALHLPASIEVMQSVVVTTKALNRKTKLQPAFLKMETVNILASSRQHFGNIEDASGMVLKRSLRTGTRLNVGMLQAPDLVTRGDSVVIVASRGDLVVRMPGTAMATGRMDQQINVRNESSDRVVKGWVKGPGEVHVPF